MKVKDLIELLQQQNENAEVCIEAIDIIETYDDNYEDKTYIDYDYYIADDLTIKQKEGKLLLVSKCHYWESDYLQKG